LPGGPVLTFDDLVIRSDAPDQLLLELHVPAGTVSGALFDRRTGQPFGAAGPAWWIHLVDEQSHRAVSASEQKKLGPAFELPGVPQGDYRLLALAYGHAEYRSGVFHHPGTGNVDLGRIALDPCGVLELTAVDEQGRPVTELEIRGNGHLVPPWSILDREAGRFFLGRLPLGQVEIELSSAGHESARRTFTLEAGIKAEARFVLPRME
jgi:hypothetical protein